MENIMLFIVHKNNIFFFRNLMVILNFNNFNYNLRSNQIVVKILLCKFSTS